jgi:erythromycin esterase-like protein
VTASVPEATLVEALRRHAHPLTGDASDEDLVLELIGDASIVLLGEATHGTHEFYRERARITRRLIEQKGFTAVAAEADWPDAARADRYARGVGDDAFAIDALADFRRFPHWMWRNTVVAEFVEWLRAHNESLADGVPKTDFYGLDLYSLHSSMQAVLHYLERVDPEAARRARGRYACFDHFGEDTQVYGMVTATGLTRSCEAEVVSQLVELQRSTAAAVRSFGAASEDAFQAEQNARVVKNAEAYYRAMFLEEVSSWNLRDRHMADTLEAIVAHHGRGGRRAKVVVWAHNSHVGDARATDMGWRGELDIGQLARERWGDATRLIGFTTHHGSVTAASDWGAASERKLVRPALRGSFEAAFHAAGIERFLVDLRGNDELAAALRPPRLERAIGVIYRPESERMSHYFQARLADQFDAVIHFDETRALEPLERSVEWERGETAETYPFGV